MMEMPTSPSSFSSVTCARRRRPRYVKPQRDSLRSRSSHGHPGSRRHRRYLNEILAHNPVVREMLAENYNAESEALVFDWESTFVRVGLTFFHDPDSLLAQTSHDTDDEWVIVDHDEYINDDLQEDYVNIADEQQQYWIQLVSRIDAVIRQGDPRRSPSQRFSCLGLRTRTIFAHTSLQARRLLAELECVLATLAFCAHHGRDNHTFRKILSHLCAPEDMLAVTVKQVECYQIKIELCSNVAYIVLHALARLYDVQWVNSDIIDLHHDNDDDDDDDDDGEQVVYPKLSRHMASSAVSTGVLIARPSHQRTSRRRRKKARHRNSMSNEFIGSHYCTMQVPRSISTHLYSMLSVR